jgi:alkylation response protein AidB-like acyl-CoA dehydrogenase
MRRTLFNSEHDMFRESYRRFVRKEVLPHRDKWRAARIVPREMFTWMGEEGYLMWADEAFGAAGVGDFRFSWENSCRQDGRSTTT